MVVIFPSLCVASSEKCGGTGMRKLMESNGKWSADGNPPPSETNPGFFRCLAACFKTQGFRAREASAEHLGEFRRKERGVGDELEDVALKGEDVEHFSRGGGGVWVIRIDVGQDVVVGDLAGGIPRGWHRDCP